jgi:hypothetical protein
MLMSSKMEQEKYFFSYASRRFWLTSMTVLGADVKQILDMREDEVVIE